MFGRRERSVAPNRLLNAPNTPSITDLRRYRQRNSRRWRNWSATIAFQAGASTSDQRQKGFEQEIRKYPGIKYIGFQISNNEPARAAAEVSSTLAAHPDLAGIFATNDRSAEGAATGLRNTGKVGVVKVVGFDSGPEQVKQLGDQLGRMVFGGT